MREAVAVGRRADPCDEWLGEAETGRRRLRSGLRPLAE
jgi:hypothetical protein